MPRKSAREKLIRRYIDTIMELGKFIRDNTRRVHKRLPQDADPEVRRFQKRLRREFDLKLRNINLLIRDYHIVLERRYISPRIPRYRAPGLATFYFWSNWDGYLSQLNMSQTSFEWLLSIIQNAPYFHNLSPKKQMPVRKQLAIFLRYMTTIDSMTKFVHTVNVGLGTAYLVIDRVQEAFLYHKDIFAIKWPSRNQRDKMREGRDLPQGFVGSLDGIHFHLRNCPSKDIEIAYYNRKKTHSVCAQAVVLPNHYIAYFAFPFRGGAHDSMQFQSTPFWQQIERYLEQDEFIFADKSYSLTKYTIIPYKGKLANSDDNKYFNECFSSIQICAEEAFHMLKSRYPRIDHIVHTINSRTIAEDLKRIDLEVRLAVQLHNALLLRGTSEDFESVQFQDMEATENRASSHLTNVNRRTRDGDNLRSKLRDSLLRQRDEAHFDPDIGRWTSFDPSQD